MRSLMDAIVAGTSPRFYIGHPIVGLTIAQLLTEAGSASETRNIVDPTYPGANGTVTWVASDPLTGTDPGGNARYWARYPDGSGGFWQRDDWPTGALSTSARINLDACAFDAGDDATTVFDELATRYIDNGSLNALWMEGLEDVSDIYLSKWSVTGDGSASELRWFRPTTSACIVRSKPWASGTEDLMGKTWTDQGASRWTASVGETVTRLRLADPNIGKEGNANPVGPAGGIATWLKDAGDAQANATDVDAPGEWHFGSGTLSVYATSNPTSYYDGMDYFTSITDHDTLLHFTNIHKLYVEGLTNRLDGGNGLEFRGRTGDQPMTGWRFSPGQSPEAVYAFSIKIETTTGFTKAGSFCTWLAGTSEFYNFGLGWSASSSTLRYEKGTIGGVHLSPVHLGPTRAGFDWLHGNDGLDETEGHALESIAQWGYVGWSGQISESGATSHVGDTNAGRAWGGFWSTSHAAEVMNILFCDKVTGQFIGRGWLPFFGSTDPQYGNSASDRLTLKWRHGNYVVGFGNTSHLRNGRPIFYDDNSSIHPQYGKTDSLTHHQNSTAFFKFVLEGVVDRDGNRMTVDIRQDGANDVLNTPANPVTVDLGVRNPITVFEATNNFNTGCVGGDFEWVNGNNDAGQGAIICAELSADEPSRNYVGRATHRGNGTDDLCISFNEVTCRFNFIDLVFGTTISDLDRAIQIQSGNQDYLKCYDTTITDCTLKDSRYIAVGSSGTRAGAHNTVINGLTTEGSARDVISIDHYTAGEFNKGHPVTIDIDTDAGIATGHTIDVASGLTDDDVWLDIAGTFYELPWEKGGSNTTRSGSPNDLVSLNHTRRWISSATSNNVFMPSDTPDDVQVIVGMAWDGDPGTVSTVPTGFSEIGAAADNLSDNSLYVKFYQGVFATGEDVWNWDGQDITKLFEWTNSRDNMSWVCAWRGQAASNPVGNSNSTPNNTAGTTPSAPTISTTANDSLVVYVCFNSGAANNTSFTGGPGGDIMRICRKSGSNYGDTGAGIGVTAAQVYAGTSGSKTGIGFSLDSSQKSITTSIELKT